MNQSVTIGGRLRDERSRLKLNQTDFGDVGGVTKKTQLLYESGERVPDAKYLSAIAATGADVLYILTGHNAATHAAVAALKAASGAATRTAGTPDEQAALQEAVFMQMRRGLPTDEQLLLDAYRALDPAARKKLLGSLLAGGSPSEEKRQPESEDVVQTNTGEGVVQIGKAAGSITVKNRSRR